MAIQKVGVIGCGLMGSGIAQVSAQAGFTTVVREVSPNALEKGVGSIYKFLQAGVDKLACTRPATLCPAALHAWGRRRGSGYGVASTFARIGRPSDKPSSPLGFRAVTMEAQGERNGKTSASRVFSAARTSIAANPEIKD